MTRASAAADDLRGGHWFVDLVMAFAPGKPVLTGTPDEMIRAASWKAFGVSTTAGLAPGPFGLATILPEMIAVTKIQIDLIHAIAAYHGKQAQVSPTLVLKLFAGRSDIDELRSAVERTGGRVIVRELSKQALRPVAQQVGMVIGRKIAARLAGRWVPVVLAPVFGAWSKSITTDIGRDAARCFGGELQVIAREG